MNRVLRTIVALAAVAAGLAAGSAAQAAQINGTMQGADTVSVTGGGSGLKNISDFTLSGAVVLASSGDLTVPFLDAITFTPSTITVTAVNGAPFASAVPVMSFGSGRWVFTPSMVQFSGTDPDVGGGSSLSFVATGTLDDTTNVLDDTPAKLSIALTQSSLNGPVTAAISFESPAAPLGVPAPAGLVLAATAVPALGLGRLIRRKKATA